MDKIKIVASGLIFPVTMMRYFTEELQQLSNVDLKIVGPFSGNWIPWNGGMTLPARYVQTPDVALPMSISRCDPAIVEKKLPWKPDLWIQFDAGFHFTRRPEATLSVTVATDPHCWNDLHYDDPKNYSDIFFNMQQSYMKPGDVYLPYAFSEKHHYPVSPCPKKYDGCLIGLQYTQRNSLVKELRKLGYEIHYSIGEVFDEFRLSYNQSRIALNWSSLNDLNARSFEAFGMKIPLLTNRVPDLKNFFVEDEDYIGFDTVEEAVQKFTWMINHPIEIEDMAKRVFKKVQAGHTYRDRVQQILKDCQLI